MAISKLAEVKVTGIIEASAKLAKMYGAAKDLSVPYKKASIYLDRWVQKNFQSQGGNVGGWLPLKAGGRWKRSKSGKRTFDASAKILQDTGALKHSFKPYSTKTDAGIGSKLPYAPPHEFGDKTRGLPQRRMLPKNKEVVGDIREIFVEHIAKSAKV